MKMPEKIQEEDETEGETGPAIPAAVLKDKLWKIVDDGKPNELKEFFNAYEKNKTEIPINEEDLDYDEDGGHVLMFCIKEGCDRGPSKGRDHVECARILVDKGAVLDQQDKAERTPLNWAVLHKHSGFISTLMQLGADPSLSDQDGISPFHLAIQLGSLECVKMLSSGQTKSLFSLKDGKGNPPLVAAIQSGNIDICRFLLEHGADVDATDKLSRTALQYAVLAKNLEIFDLLLKYKPHVDICDKQGKTVLHRICAIKDKRYLQKLKSVVKLTKSLMEEEADDGTTPVIYACKNGNSEQLKELLEEGASVTATDNHGKTALHYCADNLETQCSEMLLTQDESLLDIVDEQGFTAMHMAVIAGNGPFLKLLLKKGADIECRDNENHTVAHWATVCGHTDILDILIEHRAELSTADSHHAYPIHYAAQMNGKEQGHTDHKIGEKVLKKLLDQGVPLDVLDKDGRQPLLWAASAGNTESCKMLVKAGADLSATDKDGLSALHCAASRGHTSCVDTLKKIGGDVNKVDKNNCTPIFYAITLGNKECTKTLLKSGADPNHQDQRGRTPSHCASIKGCLDTVKILDKDKADLWSPSTRGDCPIHEATQGGHCDVVKYLLKWRNKSDAVNQTNNAGRTPLHIAAIVNNLQLCKLLLDNGADRNAVMNHKDKNLTPYDTALLKGNKETADYIKSKGGTTGGDIDNVVKTEGSKKGSAKSRKSTTGSTSEDKEPKVNGVVPVTPVSDKDKNKENQEKDRKSAGKEKGKAKQEVKENKEKDNKTKEREEKSATGSRKDDKDSTALAVGAAVVDSDKAKDKDKTKDKSEVDKDKKKEKSDLADKDKKKEKSDLADKDKNKQKEKSDLADKDKNKQKEKTELEGDRQKEKSDISGEKDKEKDKQKGKAVVVSAGKDKKKEKSDLSADKSKEKDKQKDTKDKKGSAKGKEFREQEPPKESGDLKEKKEPEPEATVHFTGKQKKEEDQKQKESDVKDKGKKDQVSAKDKQKKSNTEEKKKKEKEVEESDTEDKTTKAKQGQKSEVEDTADESENQRLKKSADKGGKTAVIVSKPAKDTRDKTGKVDAKDKASKDIKDKTGKDKAGKQTSGDQSDGEVDQDRDRTKKAAAAAANKSAKGKRDQDQSDSEAEEEKEKGGKEDKTLKDKDKGKDKNKKGRVEKETGKKDETEDVQRPKTTSRLPTHEEVEEEEEEEEEPRRSGEESDYNGDEEETDTEGKLGAKGKVKATGTLGRKKDKFDESEKDKEKSKSKQKQSDRLDSREKVSSDRDKARLGSREGKRETGSPSVKKRDTKEKQVSKENEKLLSKEKDKLDSKEQDKLKGKDRPESNEREELDSRERARLAKEKGKLGSKEKGGRDRSRSQERKDRPESKEGEELDSRERARLAKEKGKLGSKDKGGRDRSRSQERKDRPESNEREELDSRERARLAKEKGKLGSKDKGGKDRSTSQERKDRPESKEREELDSRERARLAKEKGKLDSKQKGGRERSRSQERDKKQREDSEERDRERTRLAAKEKGRFDSEKEDYSDSKEKRDSTIGKGRPPSKEGDKKLSQEKEIDKREEVISPKGRPTVSPEEKPKTDKDRKEQVSRDKKGQKDRKQTEAERKRILALTHDLSEEEVDHPVITKGGRDTDDIDGEFEVPDDSPENEDAVKRREQERISQSRRQNTRGSDTVDSSRDRNKLDTRNQSREKKTPESGKIQSGLKTKSNVPPSRQKTTSTKSNGYTDEFRTPSPIESDSSRDLRASRGTDRTDSREQRDKIRPLPVVQKKRVDPRDSDRDRQRRLDKIQNRDKKYETLRQQLQFKRIITLTDMESNDRTNTEMNSTFNSQRRTLKGTGSIQTSVRQYTDGRKYARQIHQLKRAQIYTGPMHDIVLFSKLMNVYKHSGPVDDESELDMRVLEDWEGYLQDTPLPSRSDQLRFVSHFYDDGRSNSFMTPISHDAKEQHYRLEQDAKEAKRILDSRCTEIQSRAKQREDKDVQDKGEIDSKIADMAQKTEQMFNNVNLQATEKLVDAKIRNDLMRKDISKNRAHHIKYSAGKTRQLLIEEAEKDERDMMLEEVEEDRKERHKEWMRKKDEDLRRRLMKAYGSPSPGSPGKSKSMKPLISSTPRSHMKPWSHSSPRPKSNSSSSESLHHGAFGSESHDISVQMTEYGLRRVKVDDFSFASWTPKFDGSLRPRAGLVYVEPKVYDEVLKEEKRLKTAYLNESRSQKHNLTVEDDTYLENVES